MRLLFGSPSIPLPLPLKVDLARIGARLESRERRRIAIVATFGKPIQFFKSLNAQRSRFTYSSRDRRRFSNSVEILESRVDDSIYPESVRNRRYTVRHVINRDSRFPETFYPRIGWPRDVSYIYTFGDISYRGVFPVNPKSPRGKARGKTRAAETSCRAGKEVGKVPSPRRNPAAI